MIKLSRNIVEGFEEVSRVSLGAEAEPIWRLSVGFRRSNEDLLRIIYFHSSDARRNIASKCGRRFVVDSSSAIL